MGISDEEGEHESDVDVRQTDRKRKCAPHDKWLNSVILRFLPFQ